MLVVACGKSGDVEQDEPVQDDQVSEETPDDKEQDNAGQEKDDSKATTDDKSTTGTNGTNSNSSTNETNTEDKTADESAEQNNDKSEKDIVMTGSYNGQADPHTIEVETDEGPVAYQLTMEARDMVVDLNPGDRVTYTYYQDGEMLVIKHIEVAK